MAYHPWSLLHLPLKSELYKVLLQYSICVIHCFSLLLFVLCPSVSTNSNNSSEFTKHLHSEFFNKSRYKMPKVKPVVSLFSQCINCICRFKIYNIPVNAELFNPHSIEQRTDIKSDINPFPTIRKLR
jgi:hypothetical protein